MLASLNRWFTRITDFPDFGRLLLRVTLGILMLIHGLNKAKAGISWIGDMLAAKGLPTFIAYGVYIGEIVVPVLLILGLFTRPAALIYAFNIIFAVILMHSGLLTAITNTGGWALELQALYVVGALTIMFIGGGRISIARNPDYR